MLQILFLTLFVQIFRCSFKPLHLLKLLCLPFPNSLILSTLHPQRVQLPLCLILLMPVLGDHKIGFPFYLKNVFLPWRSLRLIILFLFFLFWFRFLLFSLWFTFLTLLNLLIWIFSNFFLFFLLVIFLIKYNLVITGGELRLAPSLRLLILSKASQVNYWLALVAALYEFDDCRHFYLILFIFCFFNGGHFHTTFWVYGGVDNLAEKWLFVL